jgi:hypothetical protein
VLVLRSGRTGRVLGHRVMAPSTLGTFLRAFTFGHVRRLDRVLGQLLGRAWRAGAGPAKGGWRSMLTRSSKRFHGKRSTVRAAVASMRPRILQMRAGNPGRESGAAVAGL